MMKRTGAGTLGRHLKLALPALAAAILVFTAAAPAMGAALTFECDQPACTFSGTDTLYAYAVIDAGIVDLRGYTFTLGFDPAIIYPISVEPGPLIDGAACSPSFFWLNQFAIGDSVKADMALLGCSVDGPGRVLKIGFVGVSDGVSPLICRETTMRNSSNQSIVNSCSPGSITYYRLPPTPATPKSWGLIKSMYTSEGAARQ
jgi:hypothetical protein